MEKLVQASQQPLGRSGSVRDADGEGSFVRASDIARPRFQFPKLHSGQRVDAFLDNFALLGEQMGLSDKTLGLHLRSCLVGSGEAEDVIQQESTASFAELAEVLNTHFCMTAESYRVNFREARKDNDETFRAYTLRISRLFDKWIELSPMESMRDIMLVEKISQACSQELRFKLLEQDFTTLEEAVEFAEKFVTARHAGKAFSYVSHPSGDKSKRKGQQQGNHPAKSSDNKSQQEKGDSQGSSAPSRNSTIVCYYCRKPGHRERECRSKQRDAQQGGLNRPVQGGAGVACASRQPGPSRSSQGGKDNQETKHEGAVGWVKHPQMVSHMDTFVTSVEGTPATAIRDTGATTLFVDEKLIPADAPEVGVIEVQGIQRDFVAKRPVFVVSVSTPYFEGKVHAASLDRPVYPVIIGNTVQTEDGVTHQVSRELPPAVAAPVVTRAQAKGRKEIQKHPYPRPSLITYSREDIIRLQEQDSTLGPVKKLAAQPARQGQHKKYVYKSGILYRHFHKGSTSAHQLVVPMPLRREVLQQGHDRPLAGHLGVRRTQERIQRDFYWPGIAREVREFCRTCDSCQRSVPKGYITRVPLGSVPIVTVPFEKVAIDLVGPIKPTSARGHKYVVCVVDYATRYPEAIPLKNQEAATVAEALFQIYTRMGFPREAVTDLGTQFTSDLYRELCRFMGIQAVTTTPYHPQSNGLVERFNGTLKQMLKRLCQDQPKDWDRFIPAVLFAYRDVPQESTRFSPFEMLYGRTVRGPLTILRKLWTQEGSRDSEERTTSQYVLDLRNRVAETCRLAQNHLQQAKVRHTRNFNMKSKARWFEPGDRVLLLRPEKHNKLQLTWKGPFTVLERVGDWDYRVNITGRNKVYHANLLKRYHTPVAEACLTTHIAAAGVVPPVIQLEDTESEAAIRETSIPLIPLAQEESWEDVDISKGLSKTQADALREVCSSFSDVLTDLPGCTHLSECELRLTNQEPVRVRPYPIPHSQEETVRVEVETMLKMGVIVRSSSSYSSPIVLVRKKDGKVRFCIDYRRLNRVVEFDCEPMPDVEAIFSSVSGSKYFSKMDLTKGYWQIPMASNSQAYTAFSTPQGQFEWKVMPFGLKTAGAVFSRMMRKLIAALNDPNVQNFIDDVMIASQTWKNHLSSTKAFLDRLRYANLSARPTKCILGQREISFLGHMIGRGCLRPEEDKVTKIREAPRPTTKKELRSFLGLVGYYRKFVPHYSQVALPLTEKTKAKQPDKLKWDAAAETAYVQLKEVLCSSPVLHLPDSSKKFVLRTDASCVGLGAALLQDHDGELMPVAYGSKKLTDAESRYHIIELECYAVVWGIRRFYPFLYGRQFLVQCDHHPLAALHKIRPVSRRLMGWSMELQSHQFEFQYIRGSSNVEADFLSRLPCSE